MLLKELPKPSPDKNGWPWTEESDRLPTTMSDGRDWPKISIITPSFNHGQYIEETIRSIILQNYPALEYLVIDGGSTDNTLEIIEKYSKWITYWVSEPDRGQSAAINRGFKLSSGLFTNWICSDDLLSKNAFSRLIPELVKRPDRLFLNAGIRIDNNGNYIDKIHASSIRCFDDLINLDKYWRKGNSIMQQSALYPLKAVNDAGYLNEDLQYTMDFELWGKMLRNKVQVEVTPFEIGIYRWYEGQKTSKQNKVTSELIKTSIDLVCKNPDSGLKNKFRQIILIYTYYSRYIYFSLRSGIGIKKRIKRLIDG